MDTDDKNPLMIHKNTSNHYNHVAVNKNSKLSRKKKAKSQISKLLANYTLLPMTDYKRNALENHVRRKKVLV